MSEHVEQLDLGIRWEPNAPDAVICLDDLGHAALALVAHPADEDERTVVLRWTGVLALCVTPHNDEARHLHRLYERGLRRVLWLGVVADSAWLAEVTPAVHDSAELRHYILPLKEQTIELVARDLDVKRSDLSPPQAVGTAL